MVLRVGYLLALGFISPAVFAQDSYDKDEESVADSRAESFQTVSGSQQDEVSGGALMLGAYVVLWLGLMLYLLRLGKRNKSLEKRIHQLQSELESKA